MTNHEFIKKVADTVCKVALSYGILVHSPIIAQAILESGWGQVKTCFHLSQLFWSEMWD